MDNSKTNLTTSTWGSPYAEVSIIGKRKYARLLRVLVSTFASLCILTVLTTLSFVAFKLTTTDFESLVLMTAHQLSVCLALNQIVQFHLLYISQRNRSAVVSKDKSNENAEIGSCDPSLWLRKQVDEKIRRLQS